MVPREEAQNARPVCSQPCGHPPWGRCRGWAEVRRSDIETFGRELEAKGGAAATIARWLCTITGFYRSAGEEGLIAHSPAVHVSRPRIGYGSHAIGADRNEVGRLLVAAGLGPAGEHAIISLLAPPASEEASGHRLAGGSKTFDRPRGGP